jgi:hypothetical protein
MLDLAGQTRRIQKISVSVIAINQRSLYMLMEIKNTGAYKSGNNAYVHKSVGKHGEPGSIELADRGVIFVGQYTDAAHIGIRNSSDFPAVSGRNHGD